METLPADLRAFLLRAKRVTYAGGGPESPSSRPGSHDLCYEEPGGLLYIDSYFGVGRFIGGETLFVHGEAVWGMNYSGRVFGEGFDSAFLKAALLRAPDDAPYRGPIEYQDGALLYCNTSAGDPDWFFGREEVYKSGVSIYECVYHGGIIR